MSARVQDAPTFALIGAAGYIAPTHGAAIKAVGGKLVAACDVHDAVGWLDRDWPECAFGDGSRCMPDSDYVVVCSPNDLHYVFARASIDRSNVICEKPLGLSVTELNWIAEHEGESQQRVYTIMNLRHHPEVVRAKRMAEERRPYAVSVEYIAPRGPWYDVSWKGDPRRSGGIAFNIGIHIFDYLCWAFGEPEVLSVEEPDPRSMEVWLSHPHALYGPVKSHVHLSTRQDKPARRSIVYHYGEREHEVFDLAAHFSLGEDPNLHAACYREILAGNGPGIEQARPGIALCERINAYQG